MTHAERFTLMTGLRADDYISVEVVLGESVRLMDTQRLLRDLKARPFDTLREHLTPICGNATTEWLLSS